METKAPLGCETAPLLIRDNEVLTSSAPGLSRDLAGRP